ncbi:uncharacterized protein [Parasteatoda tepidariorum]|uniref:uncharacterized protein n=1 Tax=Parasteatoda tepidariorum TaxID=114398 RepID=UPI001C728728|nr:uncharacterized protein LOC107441838 [Parasteatoda tepidariorum]
MRMRTSRHKGAAGLIILNLLLTGSFTRLYCVVKLPITVRAMAEYFNVDEKRFLLAYSAKANNITDTIFNGILDHIYYNVIFNKVGTIDIVLKVIKELKLDLWSMFKEKLPEEKGFSHGSLLRNPEAFIRITEAGASNGSSKAIHPVYLWLFLVKFLNYEDYATWMRNWNVISRDPLNFRALQLLNVYMRFNCIPYKSAELEMAVRVLWSSIPDPLLTSTDVFRLFEEIDLIRYQKVNNIWQWYCNLVNYEGTSVRRPRSLKHLSRCFIRNRLRVNFKLPEGVEELGIPKHVQKYLLLRDFYKIE